MGLKKRDEGDGKWRKTPQKSLISPGQNLCRKFTLNNVICYNCRASDGFLWVRPHEEEGPHDVIGRPVFRDHLPLRQEVPELCHDDFGCAKKLAEGSFLRQQRPDSLAALILDVLANEEKILWRRLCSTPAFVAVHIGHG